jgi:TRAP-type C4-dicarboxylate transport system permease small subunit
VRCGARSRSGRWRLRRCWPACRRFYACRLSWQSHRFHDISTGNDATPLWIPQLAMAVGCVVMAVAFVDELVLALRGRRRAADEGAALHNE